MALNIVLIEPEIPTNTGNIGRLALASGSRLHLVKPFGFEIDDSRLKRAGLDYWQHLNVEVYESAQEFFDKHTGKPMAFLSSHGTQDHYAIEFQDELFLVFGKESVGLPKALLEEHQSQVYRVPLFSDQVRSLNLANTVGIVVYEGIRQMRGSTRSLRQAQGKLSSG